MILEEEAVDREKRFSDIQLFSLFVSKVGSGCVLYLKTSHKHALEVGESSIPFEFSRTLQCYPVKVTRVTYHQI